MLEKWDNYRILGTDAVNCSNFGNYWKQEPWHDDQTAQQELLVCVWHLLNPSDRNEALALHFLERKMNERETPREGHRRKARRIIAFSGNGLGARCVPPEPPVLWTLVSCVFSSSFPASPQSYSRVVFLFFLFWFVCLFPAGNCSTDERWAQQAATMSAA